MLISNCCNCGSRILEQNNKLLCIDCILKDYDLTSKLRDQFSIKQCRQCRRFVYRNGHVYLHDQSIDILNINKKEELQSHPYETEDMENYLRPIISKQKSFLFFDFKFKTSDFYSKYLNIDILISKIHPDIIFSNNYILKFWHSFRINFINEQCKECKKSFTPDAHLSTLQLRQKGNRYLNTLCNLHELLIKTIDIHDVKIHKEGIDFTFLDFNGASKASNLIRANSLVLNEKTTTKLVTADVKNNIEKRNKVVLLEIFPFNKYDFVVLKKSGKISFNIINKISNNVVFADVDNNIKTIFGSFQLKSILNDERDYIKLLCDKKNLVEFKVVFIDESDNDEKIQMIENKSEGNFLNLKLLNEKNGLIFDSKWGFWTKGHIKEGDYVMGYYLNGCVFNDNDLDSAMEMKNWSEIVFCIGRKRNRGKKSKNKNIKINEKEFIEDMKL